MLLSEYIEGLQQFMSDHGDMEAYYSSDDEGNSYQLVGYKGSLYYLSEDEKNRYKPELISAEDTEYIEEAKEEECELTPVCVIN